MSLEELQCVNVLLRENEMLRTALGARESDVRRAEDARASAARELERMRMWIDASCRLHASVDMTAVLAALEEMLIEVIGSERAAIYFGDSDAGFELASSFGIDRDALIPHIRGPRAIDRICIGETFATPDRGELFSACVPLNIGDRFIGAILIFRPRREKDSLEPLGHQLLDLLAVHASTALYCAALNAAAEVA